jgi:hypothetical protein
MGQITPDSVFGKHLIALAEDQRYTKYLDIGTCLGQGTTLCLYSGLKNRPETKLFSVEANRTMYEKACDFYTPRPANVRLILGKMADGIMPVYEICRHPLFEKVNHHFQLHYTQDVIDMTLSPIVENLPNMDVAVLDGGEFCGAADMEAVLALKPKVIALDDINVIKNNANHNWLAGNREWELLATGYDNNGWSIFRRI